MLAPPHFIIKENSDRIKIAKQKGEEMKKKIFSIFMLIALVFAVPFAFMGCNNSETDDLNKQIQELQQEKIDYLEQQIDELQKENAELEDENATLQDEIDALEQIVDNSTAFYQLNEESSLEISISNGSSFIISNASNSSYLYLDCQLDCTLDIDYWGYDSFGDYNVTQVDSSTDTNYVTPGSGIYKFTVSMDAGQSATLTLTLTQTARE